MTELGSLLEAARTRAALSQGALAGLLRVSQQSVSRWERGGVRPARRHIAKLAEVLDLDVAELTATASKTSPAQSAGPLDDQPEGLAPVRPLTQLLPFQHLTPEDFERAITDLLVRHYRGAEVSQLGSQGDDQRGFDILVVQTDGRRIGIQCKREKQFGPKKVKEAVEAAELEVDESIIALSRTATAEARFEMDKHVGWHLWDLADLVRLIRRLDIEDAYQVVHTYFPGHVEAFLGLPSGSPWRTAEEFYRDSPHTGLDHRQALVGRAQIVNDIVTWVADPEGSELAIIVGRGGLGKSKLLWEVASRAEGAEVHLRFLATGQRPAIADFDHLPRTGHLVVVLDDVHGIDQVAGIVSQLRHARPGAKVLMATRPYGRAELDYEIWQLNQAPRTVPQWELADLTQSEAAELVASLMSRAPHDPFTQQLAAVSRDCPFIAVVAADLFRRGELTGKTFASDAALRRDVFRRFADQMAGPKSGPDGAERRSVLAALATFQPVRLDDPDFEAAVGELAGHTSWDAVNGRIRDLEDAGLVLRRGGTAIRVIPDMFADVLVADAAYDDRSGQLTSFLTRAQKAARGSALQHLLVNASRIDWQVRDGRPGRTEIVTDLWAALHDRILRSSFDDQLALLKLVSRIAYYQPDLALQLVDDVLAAEDRDGTPSGTPWSATRLDVLHCVPPILQNVAYSREFLPAALERLWVLAQEDQRLINQHPDHPVRILQGIADLRAGKPFEYIHAVIDAASCWLAKSSRLSPFDVLEPILATVGTDQVWSERALTLYSFSIDPALFRPVRQRVVDLAFTKAKSPDIPSAVRAIKTLEEAIRGPVHLYNRVPSDDERDRWAAEFLPIIDRLGQLGTDPDRDPSVRMAIRQALAWHADFSGTATKQAAQAALASLATTTDDDLAACLHAGWDLAAMRKGLSFEEAEREQYQEFSRVAAAITEGRTDSEILERLENRLRIEKLASGRVDQALRFLADFFRGRPSAASLLCERALTGELSELAGFIATAIGALAISGNSGVIEYASSMLASDNQHLQRGAASGLSWNRGGRVGLLPGEDAVLGTMARHGDVAVRAMSGRAAFVIGMSDPATALDLLTKIEFRGSPQVAADALGALMAPGPLNWADTVPALRSSILDQLVEVGSIDAYEIKAALGELSRVDPFLVTRMLMRRSERQAILQSLDYEALPYHWDPALQIQQTGELTQCLTEVRDWMTRGDPDSPSYQLEDQGAQLYQLVAGGWNGQALATVADFGSSPTEARLVTAARILAHAPVDVLLKQVPTVTQLLRNAESLGRDSAELTLRTLLTSNGLIMQWAGQVSEEEKDELGQARQVTESLPRGSIERRFFDQLADRIAVRHSWITDSSFPKNDGRDWG